VGFKAVYMSWGGTRDAQFGIPPIDMVTMTETVNSARYIVNSVNVPVIVNADDGFGGAFAAFRTTQEFIRAGTAALTIGDRKHFIQASAPHNLIEVLPRDEYLGKMRAVLEARNQEDKDVIIVAVIEAGAMMGDDEVLARAKACVKLGVDVIFPHSIPKQSKFGVRTPDRLKQLYQAIGAPEILIWGFEPNNIMLKDYEDAGAKMWAGSVDIAQITLDSYQKFFDTKIPGRGLMQGPSADRLRKLRGLDFWIDLEKKCLLKSVT
jgi:2-methylisocitrate lyase-like PEP mutase family enzyme